jgi:hypothetical protein
VEEGATAAAALSAAKTLTPQPTSLSAAGAITGAIISSNPCVLRLAAVILTRFSDTAASHLPTSDCATYVRVAADAATNHHRYCHRLAANLDTHVFEGLPEGERERTNAGRKMGSVPSRRLS